MYTSVYTASTQLCTWYVAIHGRVHEPRRHVTRTRVYVYKAMYTAVYGPSTRPKTARYAPCTWSCTRPIHSRVHVRLHGPCTRPVHGRVQVPCTGPCTRHVHGRRRPYRRPYTVMYTGGVDGPCARPIHGRVRALYTAQPLYGRVRAVFAGEDVFTGRVHGRRVTGTRHVTRPRTRPVRSRTTAVYTAVDGPYTDV